MRDKSKTLVVVEGERAERVFFTRMASVCGMNVDVYPVGGNVYAIYQYLKRERFDVNVKDVVAELSGSSADREILKNDFVDTFMVFDCDAHHTDDKAEASMPIRDLVLRNMTRIAEMAEHLTDSTDPTRGKLFVNYPMFESFRDCDEFFDLGYADRRVPLSDMPSYKRTVAKRKLCREHVDAYTRSQFESLAKMNVFKLAAMATGRFGDMGYAQFERESIGANVIGLERRIVEAAGEMSVLNTSLFLPFDYFGNRNGYYDKVVRDVPI